MSHFGPIAGGGILNVESLEELDAIMAAFPLGPFSNVTVYGLADLEPTLNVLKDFLAGMSAQ